ncbi:uncharacterized protein LOC106092300 [Stomoxys calcitrans]|uniref:uncharacterized protein LOC106092300 n=1 Tax=Stomoxys calcitrans TaxID=35570 RepID=UPI0027E2769F|nr:uncharacterized protein LOC106092300 [Stomoxys calcitrans]
MDFLSYYVDSEDEMPSNDENEDAFPSPTNCCGILFGLTNKQIVLEFLQQLGQYPCLYKFKKSQNVPMKSGQFQESITRLRTHINGKFNIDMSDVETRLSIQRIKHWYCRTLQAIEHSKECSKPYKHSFPVYFEMLNSYMSADVSYTRDLLFGRSVQNKDSNELTRYPRWMLCKKGTKSRRGKPIGRKRLIPKETNKERLPPQDDSVVLPLQEKFLVYDEIASSTETEEETVSETYNGIAVHPEPIICDICFVDFRHRLDLKRHRVRHFPPKHPCLICRRMHFTRPMANKCQHNDDSAELHTAEDNQLELNHHIWVCEICGSTYKTMGNLNYHKRNKHSSQRLKCGICGYGTIRTDNLLRHQQKFHTVEFGTCDEIAKRSRARPKIPFSIEARREYLWIQKMKAKLNPGIRFYGCFRCNKIFKSRQEKRAHNRKEHPITENTVVCLLCQHDNVLFANTTNLRRHYIDIHNVAIEDVESLLKHAKPLLKILSPDEVDYLQSSENHNQALEQILSKKPHMAARECISDTKLMYHQQVSQAALTSFDDDDDDSNDDLYESTLWEEVDQGYDELYAVKESQAVPELHEMEHHVKDELPEDMARGICIVQEHYANYYLEADAEQNLDADQDDHLKCDDQVKTENFSDLIIEEIPEENFVSNEELEQYFNE